MTNHNLASYRTTIKEFFRENISDDDIERTDYESQNFQDIDELYELNDKIVDKCPDFFELLFKYVNMVNQFNQINKKQKNS